MEASKRSNQDRAALQRRLGTTGQDGSKASNRESASGLLYPDCVAKVEVAGLRIFRENTKREAIADSYNLIRVAEVAWEFNVRR